jgi:hypothetical protein
LTVSSRVVGHSFDQSIALPVLDRIVVPADLHDRCMIGVQGREYAAMPMEHRGGATGLERIGLSPLGSRR